MFRNKFGNSSLKTCLIGRKYNCQETKPPVAWTDDNSESTGLKWLVALNKCEAEWAETNYFTTSLQNAHVKILKYLILKELQGIIPILAYG